MARDLMQEEARRNMAASVSGGLSQLGNATTQIIAVVGQLQASRVTVTAGVAGGEYDQADVDKIDALTPKVAALLAAAQTYKA